MQAHFSLKHFTRLMGPDGLYQHADRYNPLLAEGYCTDDNARAVRLLVRLVPILSGEGRREAERLLAICWKFIQEARQGPGSYVNFRDAGGKWLPRVPESEDMYARVISCLVEVMVNDQDRTRRDQAGRKLEELAGKISEFTAPRAWAETIVAMNSLIKAKKAPDWARDLLVTGHGFLAALWQKNAAIAWPWFEPVMTYGNAIFPYALLSSLTAGRKIDNKILRESADFLIDATLRDGRYVPIGSDGWYAKGGRPSTNNQQPIEAGLMFEFGLEYQRLFPDRLTIEKVAAPYLWFYGRNTGHVVMADIKEGASYDGLFDKGINNHRGAESMLAYLWAELLLRGATEEIRTFINQEKRELTRKNK